MHLNDICLYILHSRLYADVSSIVQGKDIDTYIDIEYYIYSQMVIPGVSNSIYLGAAGGRVGVRLGRIKYSTKKYTPTHTPTYPCPCSYKMQSNMSKHVYN